jgi:uncharacterized membrane protein YgdD (TMEM256/DUF423 family)
MTKETASSGSWSSSLRGRLACPSRNRIRSGGQILESRAQADYHAFALIAVAWVTSRGAAPLAGVAGWAFVAGILLFSGSLYLLVLTGTRWLGAITPFGGIAFLLGWCLLALGALRAGSALSA